MLCDDECESVSHVLWECPAYSIYKLPCRGSLEMMGLSISSRLIVSGKHPLFWVVRINLVLCLALLKVLFWMFGS